MARYEDYDYDCVQRSTERNRERSDRSISDYSGRKHYSHDEPYARSGSSYYRDRERSPTSSRRSPPAASHPTSSHSCHYDDRDSRRPAPSRWDQRHHDINVREPKRKRYENDDALEDSRVRPQTRPSGCQELSINYSQSLYHHDDATPMPNKAVLSSVSSGIASSLSKPTFLPAAAPKPSTVQSLALGSPVSPSTPISTIEDGKMRAKRERLEAWRKEREAKKALEQAKLRAQTVAAAHTATAPGTGTYVNSRPLPIGGYCADIDVRLDCPQLLRLRPMAWRLRHRRHPQQPPLTRLV